MWFTPTPTSRLQTEVLRHLQQYRPPACTFALCGTVFAGIRARSCVGRGAGFRRAGFIRNARRDGGQRSPSTTAGDDSRFEKGKKETEEYRE